MKKKRLVIYFCICLALFVLLGVSFFYLSKLNALEKYSARVDNSYRVIIQTNKLEQKLLNAETGQRGFLLTREPIFLENYLGELKGIPGIFLELDYLTYDSFIQQKSLDTLKSVINIQLKLLKTNLVINDDDTMTLYRFHESNIYMNKIRRIIGNIKNNETYLLTERKEFKALNNKESRKSSFVSLTISFTVCCVAAIAIISFFNRSETHRFNLEDKVHKLNILNNEVKELTIASTHNLQEPMRKVQVMIDRLQYKKDLAGEHFNEQINRIKQIYNQQQAINNSIVNYYRILSEAGKSESIDLNSLIKNVAENYKKENQFELKIDPLNGIQADPHQLNLLFDNIINNSIHFQHTDRKLYIHVWGEVYYAKENKYKELNQKKYYTVNVSDNGKGIDSEYHYKVFNLFQKMEQITGHDGMQTGMGLSFCRRIMLNHTGWITAKNNKPYGLTITLFFPIA